ncbi:MAG: response regulator [Actinomycetota bacterium]|nr:response regulator [Actinomycetota bacterium]
MELRAALAAAFPEQPLPGGGAAARHGDTARAGGNPRPLQVLLVEDDADTRQVLARLLRGAGHAVMTADTVASARQALESANGATVELLVSDLSLPDGTGLDVVRALRGLRPGLPSRPVKAIAVSGLGMADDVRASLEAGFDHHLTKPISFDTLLHVLVELVAA